MKAVGVAIAVVAEILFIAYKLATWKRKLKGKITDALKQWQDETLSIVTTDLAKLREENIETIKNIANDIKHTFDDVKSENIDECTDYYIYAQQIGKKLGIK